MNEPTPLDKETEARFDEEFIFYSETNDESGHYSQPCLNTQYPNNIKLFIAQEKQRSYREGAEEERNTILADIERWSEDFGWGSTASEIISMINKDEQFQRLTGELTPPQEET